MVCELVVACCLLRVACCVLLVRVVWNVTKTHFSLLNDGAGGAKILGSGAD